MEGAGWRGAVCPHPQVNLAQSFVAPHHSHAPLPHAPGPAQPACSITWLGMTPAPLMLEPGLVGVFAKSIPACVCALPRLRFLDVSGGAGGEPVRRAAADMQPAGGGVRGLPSPKQHAYLSQAE